MDKRIFGIETEFGISYSSPDSRPLAPEEVARYLFRKVVSWGRSSNVFLTNGSRLYLDVGSHPEYATAECDDLAQLIAHDRAGELILDDLVDEAQARLAAEGFNGTVYLFKNNTDSAGNSYGSHENYLIPRRGEFSRLAEILIPVPRHPPADRRRRQDPEDARMGPPSPSRSARTTSGRASPPPPPGPGPSSTPGTSRTPTPSSTAGCT